MTSTSPWRIELLGHLWAVRDADRIERFRRGTDARLLALLAFRLGHDYSREQLVDWFWPDATTGAGRTSLRVALNSLRRRLEPPGTLFGQVLTADRSIVRLNVALVATDIAEFESRVQAAWKEPSERICHLERSVALYRGELLPGNLDDWARDERERLAGMFLDALCDLARALEERGETDRAIGCAARAVAADPLNEEACLTLLRLYAGAGRGSDGLKLFEKFRCRLGAEFGWEPSQEMKGLAKELQADPRRFLKARPDHPALNLTKPNLTNSTADSRLADPKEPGSTEKGSERDGLTHNLPALTTRFFGREEEIDSVTAMITDQGHRLVTLTGIGGSGKTRLALELASRLTDRGDIAWFVPLADVEDASLIPQAVLAVLGGKPNPDEDPLGQIEAVLSGPTLSGRASLLVLDNFERLAEEGGSLILRLLECIPGLACLITSRRHLGLSGERVVDVPPLPLPEAVDTLQRLARRTSVRMFVDRAQAKAPEFQITERNRLAVIELVRGLEGIPLALEMAAVWIRVRTPARMVEELDDRYQLLSRNLKGVPDRHQTLLDTIAWSYGLLSPQAMQLLMCLSVFRGSWTIEAAEAVYCKMDDQIGAKISESKVSESKRPGTATLLTELQEHSWITSKDDGNRMRFRMLQTLWEFAERQRDQAAQTDPRMKPEMKAEIGRRHADYYWQLLEEAKYHFDGPQQHQWIPQVAAEWDNLSAAVRWYLANDAAPARSLRMASNLCRFCEIRGYPTAGRTLLEAALAKPGESSTKVRGPALNSAGWLAFIQGDYVAALPRFEGALAAALAAADREDETIAQGNLGLCHQAAGRYDEAAICFRRGGELAREIGAKLFEANARGNLANLLDALGQHEEACSQYLECVPLFEALGNRRSEAIVWINMGGAFSRANQFAQAQEPYRRGLRVCHELQDRWLIAACFEGLATVYAKLTAHAKEDGLAVEELEVTRLEVVGLERAVRLLGIANRLRLEIGIPVVAADREAFNSSVEQWRKKLGAAVFEQAWLEGDEATPDQAVGWEFSAEWKLETTSGERA